MLKPETIRIQQNMAAYVRTGKGKPIPGLTPGRLTHYKRLVNNIVFGTISQAYPIARKVLSTDEWNYMLHNFFVEHDAQTPILWRLPYEFYLYAKDYDYASELNKPWLSELLWLEWLEIEIHMMPDQEHPDYVDTGDPVSDPLVVNRESRLIQLQYPVHLYPVREVESKKGNYFLAVFREQLNGTVKFINLSPLHARLIDMLVQADQPYPTAAFLKQLSLEFQLKDENELRRHASHFITEMMKSGLVLGFAKKWNN